jgi:UDP-N-acetylglucosamine 3-dehydrogenase
VRSDRAPGPLRGVIVGLGAVARAAHLPAYRDPRVADRLEIVAAIDPVRLASPDPGLPIFDRREALAGVGRLDFLDICTPPAAHLELAIWALERGLHVICEKPVAVTQAEAQRLGDAARAADRVVMACHQHRHSPAWSTLRGWITSGKIGHFHLAEIRVHRPRADPGIAAAAVPWRGRAVESRGGVLLDHGPHVLAELLTIAGPPLTVRAWTGRLLHRDYDVEDTAHVLLGWADRSAAISLTWAAQHRATEARFVGDRGTITWLDGTLRCDAEGRAEIVDVTRAIDKAAYPGWFAELFLDFVTAIDAGDIDGPLDEIEAVAELLERIAMAAV